MSASTASNQAKGKGKAVSNSPGSEQTAAPVEETEANANPADSEKSKKKIEKGFRASHSADHKEALICESTISGPYIGGAFSGEPGPAKRQFEHLALGSDVKVTISSVSRAYSTPYDGFTLEFSLAPGSANEMTGFGVRYEPNPETAELGTLLVAKTYKILVSQAFLPDPSIIIYFASPCFVLFPSDPFAMCH